MMFYSRIRQIGRAVDQAQRFRTIVAVFFKYGYDDVARKLPLPGLWRWLASRRFRREQVRLMALPRPERLRRAFEELGPAFVKLGQLLAGRKQILPAAYTEELGRLNDQVAPAPFAALQAILATELGRPLADCFRRIDETPLGSASIAQVYGAQLADGTEAVVKIQRPEIEHLVRTDLAIMQGIAEMLERHIEGWDAYHPGAIVAEFSQRMERELDFSEELAAMERFGRQFAGDATVRVPRVFRALSTRRVLTMERMVGIRATQVGTIEAAGLDRGEIARRLSDLTLRQIFVHGFFHGDPHPGNLLILPDNVVCFLDFGMTGFLVSEVRDEIAALFAAIAAGDERAAAKALLVLAGAELDPPRAGLESDMADFIQRNFAGDVRSLVFVRLLQSLFRLTARHRLILPPEIFTAIKALGQIEQVIHELSPDLDLMKLAEPFVREVRLRRLKPRRVLRELMEFNEETLATLRILPLEFRRAAVQLRDGKTTINFRLEGLQPLDETLERTVNRLSLAMILSAIIVASALMIHAGLSPLWHGISIIGLAGCVSACLLGLVLVVSMIRHGRI
jgi:ubiquinone biosynthesis protein